LRRAAELAVKYCPTHALSIVEDEVEDVEGGRGNVVNVEGED